MGTVDVLFRFFGGGWFLFWLGFGEGMVDLLFRRCLIEMDSACVFFFLFSLSVRIFSACDCSFCIVGVCVCSGVSSCAILIFCVFLGAVVGSVAVVFLSRS